MDPFDRLIKLVDQFVAENNLQHKFYAQIGRGKYRPKNFSYCEFLNPEEYQACIKKCSLVVSHAGMGTIITAIEMNKPIVILPKRASLNEQRNEHQLATVHHFHKSPLVIVAENNLDLSEAIFRANSISLIPESGILLNSHPCDASLIDFVQSFVMPPSTNSAGIAALQTRIIQSLLKPSGVPKPLVFLTVGNEPCDRLVKAFDEWAAGASDQLEVIAQIGKTDLQLQHCAFFQFLKPAEYARIFSQSALVVSHAGMGTIITSIKNNKWLVLLPRLASLGETRNEHQLATVQHFKRYQGILVADTPADLATTLDKTLAMISQGAIKPPVSEDLLNSPAVAAMIQFVREFVSR